MSENSLIVTVQGDTSELQEALKKANNSLNSFQRVAENVSSYFHGFQAKMALVGLAFQGLEKGFSWIQSGIAQFTEFGDHLDKMSIRTGIAAQSLSAMKYAAEQSGAGFDELCDAIKTFQEQLGAAKLGDAGAIGKLGAFGIRAEDMEGLSSQEQFMELAEHLSQITDRSEQTRVAIELFGDAGYKLLPMLQQGKDGMKSMMEEAERLGITMGQEDVASAAAMTDEMNRLKSTFSATIREGIAAIAEPLVQGMTLVRKFGERVVSLLYEFQDAKEKEAEQASQERAALETKLDRLKELSTVEFSDDHPIQAGCTLRDCGNDAPGDWLPDPLRFGGFCTHGRLSFV